MPQITKLEKKLGMLQGLDPVLEGILSDLNKVTDFSNMIKLQGRRTASVAAQQEEEEDAEGADDEDSEGAQKLVTKASASAVKAVEELEDPGSAATEMAKVKSKIKSK